LSFAVFITTKNSTMKPGMKPFAWLGLGALLMIFSNGRWIIPLATWLYPVFFLRFLHSQKTARGLWLLWICSALVSIFIWRKMIPAPGVAYYFLTGVALQIVLGAYLADRLLFKKLKGFTSTLIFPLAYCIIEYVSTFIPSKGSWVSLAYTQTGNLPIMQLASVTGIWGITFLITWFASVMTWMWERAFQRTSIFRGALWYLGIFFGVLLYGTLRLHFTPDGVRSVMIASVVQERAQKAKLSSCHWTDAWGVGQYSPQVEENLLEKTRMAANAGAKIILWQEAASWLPKREEEKFVSQAANLAREKKIWLLMTLWSIPEDYPKQLVENKIVILNPEGQEQLTYIKNKPVAVEPIIKGNGKIPVLQTPYGRIAPAICFDDAFPFLIRQSGMNGADILFIPANDWKEIDPIHTEMAIVRAIENGAALVRPAGSGLSAVTDNRGRKISAMDFFRSEQQIMYAEVPVAGSSTLYALWGDWFALGCVAVFCVILSRVIISGMGTRNKKLPAESLSPDIA